jgi:phosphatidylglycerophosphate synthase
MSAEQNFLQRTAEATHGIVTPANALDVVAFGLAVKYAPELDTKKGIAIVGAAFLADLADGLTARATGTVSEVGANLDPFGDKVKLGVAGYHIYKKKLASNTLLALVGTQSAANVGAAVYDHVNHRIIQHEKPRVKPDTKGKRSVFSNAFGLGLQVIGTEVAKTNLQRGRRFRSAGAAIGYAGLALYGVRATRDYWRTALS